MANEKIFLTGHRGMVGSALYERLKSNPNYNILTQTSSELNLTDQQKTYEFFEKNKIDMVIIAAAKVGGIKANMTYPAEFTYINLQIQNNLFEASRNFGVKKVVFLGSSCVYPKECPQPMKEEHLMTGLLEPTNEGYALAKIIGLRMAKYYKSQYGLEVICPMPCNLYGKNDSFDPNHSHVLSALIKKFYDAKIDNKESVTVWGAGVARREFMNVSDAVDAIIFLMEDWKGGQYEFINLGTGSDISIKELAELIAKKTGFTGKLEWDTTKPDGMLKKCLDVSKITELGYTPSVSLEQGIEEMIEEYKKLISK